MARCSLFLSVALFALLPFPTAAAPCHPADLLPLRAFAGNLSAGGGGGELRAAWSGDACCAWDGVVCDAAGRVTALRLPGRGLAGPIPPSLAALARLQDLDLSHNALNGGISALVAAVSLRTANLSSNLLDGSLLDLAALPRLAAFNASNNSLSGALAPDLCAGAPALRVLDLSANLLAGTLPPSPPPCAATLQELYLASNSFHGALPAALFGLAALQKLSLASNGLAGQDEAKSKKLRSSRGKQRRRGRHSRSSSTSSRSETPPQKRSKKLKISDKKSTKNKGGGSRRRHRCLSPSPSPSSSSMSYSTRSSSGGGGASERSVSPPRRSHSRDVRKKKKERGRDSKRVRRSRRSTSYSTSGETTASSRSRSRSKNSKSRNRKSGGNKDHASRDKIVQDYDNGHAHRAENVKSVEVVDRDEKSMAVTSKGSSIERSHSIDIEKNEPVKKIDSPPTKDADGTEDILPAGSGSPDAQDLELILRQKALENFRKFRGAAIIAGKTQINGTGKEAVTGSPKSSDMKIAEACSVDKPFQRQRSGLSVNCSVGSPRLEDFGNHTTPRKQESSPGKSVGAESPGTFEAGSTSGRTEQKVSSLEPTRSNSQIRLQDVRSSSSIMHRLGSPPRSSASVIRRLGSSAGVSYVNGNPRVRSVVSIPTKEGFDSGTSITPPSACDNSLPVENISEVRHSPIETNKVEGTKGDERNSGEASAPNVSTLSTCEAKDQPGTEVKDGSQFEKKTFSRMHEGETVQVSYKVYIPKKSPALARRKLQR